jgi:D-arabinose 1-dehydrogenase-like Zn-dependent alcohol dehydrogenase
VVVAGATTGFNPPAELNRLFGRQLSVVGTAMGTREELQALVQMLVATGVRPVIDSTYPLSEATDAYARMSEGAHFGKIVLTNDA